MKNIDAQIVAMALRECLLANINNGNFLTAKGVAADVFAAFQTLDDALSRPSVSRSKQSKSRAKR